MEQLQESIKKDIIRHPFKNIEVIYEADKTTLSPQDEELLAMYIRLHDYEWGLNNTANALYKESVAVNKAIETLHEQLEKVKITFDVSRKLADKLSAENYVSEETSLEKLAEARVQTEIELASYNEKILEVFERAKVLQEKINKYIDDDDKEGDGLYGEITNLSIDHIANWENNSINAVAFDEQFDQFREYRTFAESQRETLMTECDDAMENYTNLNIETTGVYNVWNEFIKRCDLLVTMSQLQNNATGFTEN